MSEEVKRVKKEVVVEEEVVEMKIEISAKLFDQIEKAKKEVADKRGYDISYGKYIEEAFNDFIIMIGQQNEHIQKLTAHIEAGAAIPPVVDNKAGEKSPEEKEAEAAAMEQMYGHISKSGKGDPMFV